MPEDKPYLQKIYSSLGAAYGANGSIAKNVFRMSFDDFSKSISSNPGYAEKIYSAVDAAYGPNGKLKAGAFNSSLDAFKGKVLMPNVSKAEAAPTVSEQVQPVNAPQQEQPATNDPNARLLASGQDLQLPEQQAPGVIADQSAIEPLIADKQRQDDADLERGKELLLTPKSELAGPSMTSTSGIPTDQEISIQDKLHQLDVQDKRLHSVQEEADAFAKTTAGGLYYSFVRPVYQSLVGTGGNLLAGTARVAGDLGESLGLDKSKKILDKTADGLTDLFDFNRLAREGNTSSYLNATPTSQEGKLSKTNILPRAMEAITSMGTLIGGSRVMGGDAGGLFVSNYMATYEDYHKQARNAGLTNLQADQFAITSAGVNSALLMISPETFIGKAKGIQIENPSVFKAIKSGVSVKDAVRNGIKGGLKQLGEANAIVLSTDIANHVLRTGADLMTREKHFNEHSLAPSMSEALETSVLTSIAMGALNGRRFGRENTPSNLERSAWVQAAERPEIVENGINKALEAKTIQPAQAERIRSDVAEYTEIYNTLKQQVLPENPNADLPRLALEALKSKKQAEETKPLSGIPGLKTINEKVKTDQEDTKRNIEDALNGFPEVGETVSSDNLKEWMRLDNLKRLSNLKDKVRVKPIDNISKNDYKLEEINLEDLYKNNAKFRAYADREEINETKDDADLNTPAIINENGDIISRRDRLAQQYREGNKTARAFIETPSAAPVETEKSGISVERLKAPNVVEKVKLPDENVATEQNIELKIIDDAAEIKSPTEMDVREQATDGQGVREGTAEHQIATEQSQQPETQSEATQETPIEKKTIKPKTNDEALSRRNKALAELKKIYHNTSDEQPNTGNSDKKLLPINEQNTALSNSLKSAIKEELSFRGTRIQSMSIEAREKVKDQMYQYFHNEAGISKEHFNEAFESIYKQQSEPLRKESELINDLFDGTKSTVQIVNGIKEIIDDKFLQQQIESLLPYLEKNKDDIRFSQMFTQGVGEAFTTGDWTVLPSHTKNIDKLSHAVIHELYHVISLNELFNNITFGQKITDLIHGLRDQLGLSKYFDGVGSGNFGAKKDMKFYGLLNEAEFIAEIFSNKQFSDLVDKTELGKKKPILTRVIDFVKSSLGIKSLSNSDKIREMILSSIDNKIQFEKSDVDKHTISVQQENARKEQFIYSPESKNTQWASKESRDKAAQHLREEWSNFQSKERIYQKKGIDLPDPIQDKKFYKAVVDYAKEEILYRANQVKGFAKMKKAQIKSAVRRAMAKEGIKIGISEFTDMFDNAYSQIKKIPGVLGANIDRVSFKEYIKGKIQAREKGRNEGFSTGRQEGLLTAKERVEKVNNAINETLKKWDVSLTADQQKKVTSLLNNAATYKDIERLTTRAIDLTTIFAAKNKTKLGDKGFDSVSFKDYIKGKMLSRERGKSEGIKQGLEEARVRVRAVKAAINETIKESGINLSMLQMRRVVSLLQQSIHGGDIGKSIDRAIDATTQMVWEAKHKAQIADTKKLIKSVNGLKRSKSMVLQDVEWLKQLQLPTPSRVDDISTYQEMLKDYVSSRKGDNTNPKYTREEISEFVQDENARIHKEKMEGMQTDLDGLKEKGVIPDDVTLDDYIAMLDNASPSKLSEGINKKAEILRGDLKTRLGYLKERLAEFEGEEKSVVDKLTNVDISELKGAELVQLNNVLNNIAEYGSLDAAGGIITSHEARVMNKELAESGDKLRALPNDKILSKKNLSNYISALFYNDGAISRFRAKVLGGIENKTSHVKQRAQKVVKEFVELNKKHKIDGLSNAKLFAYSYLNQYRGIEAGEITDNLKQRLDELIDDATYLFDKGSAYRKKSERNPLIMDATNRFSALERLGLLDYEINGSKLTVNIKDAINTDNAHEAPEILHSLLTEGEQAVYKFVRDHYDEIHDHLEFNTRVFGGKVFQNERNYVSLVSRPKTGAEDRIKDLSEGTDITGHLQSINAKPANTTISRSNKKSANIYYDGDFFSNFVNRYYTSLYTAEVLPELQRTAKMVNSDDFKKFITGQFDVGLDRNTDRNYTKFKEKLADAINEEKYAPFFKKGRENLTDKVISKGVKMVLGNIWQGPKQYVPALLHNLTINNTKAVGYALASRGKAIVDPITAAARKAFLENFTGVQRSTMGSAAYDEYVRSVNDEMSWWMHPMQWMDKAAKISSFVLEKADHMAQNDAYIASYVTSLIREGKIKSVSDFDIAEAAKNPDKEALAYAEQMASNINNESAKAYRPETLKDSEKAKYLWLLQGFSLNAYQNAMNKLKIISDNRSTGSERKEAIAHFMGYLAEVGSYQLVGKTARGLQMTIAAALLSAAFGLKHEENDEEKKDRKKKENIKVGANIAADLALSGLNAPLQGAIKITANYAYSQWAKAQVLDKKAMAKQKGEKFDPRGTYLSPYYKPYYGVDGPGGAADFYSSLAQKGVDEIVKGANAFDTKETVEDTESKKIAKNLNLLLGIPSVVLGSGDLMILNTRMQTILKEASKKEKKPAASGGSARGGSRGRAQSSRSRI